MKQVILLEPEEYNELMRIKSLFEAQKGTEAPKAESKAEVASQIITQNYPKVEHDGKPYSVLSQSKIKVRGILEKLLAHPALAPALKTVDKGTLEKLGEVWLPVTIYKTEYDNPDGSIWVRMKEDFDSSFKPI